MKVEIHNLDCSSCARKIEEQLKKNNISIEIDFVNSEATIDKTKIEEANKLISKIEPGVYIGEKKDKRNFKIYLNILAIILFVVAIVYDINFLYYITYILVAYNIIRKTILNFKNKIFLDENTLMLIASVAAMAINEQIEAIILVSFFEFGEYLESLAVKKSSKSIEQLLDKRNSEILMSDKTIKNVKDVKAGEEIIIKPEEVVALDGKVLNSAQLDLSALNGESKIVLKESNEFILSGSINKGDVIYLEVVNEYENSYLSNLTNLIKDAQKNKAQTEKFITKFAKIYTPIVVFLAILIFIIQATFLGFSVHDAIYNATILLVISCPCALVISIPLGYFGGIGLASKNNILVKGSAYLEEALHITDIIFDKTGTLTTGEFKVIEVDSIIDKDEFINIVCSAEKMSNHIIAKQIVKAFDYKEVVVEDFKQITSKGISFKYNSDQYLIGNNTLTNVEIIKSTYNVIYVTKNEQYIGHLIIGDYLKEDSKDVIDTLLKNNIDVHLVSGDSSDVVQKVSNQLGITNFVSQYSAEEKTQYLRNLQEQGKKVMFVGDGVNDALSIVKADLGVSVSSEATDITVETSDIVLSSSRLNSLIDFFKISKLTRNIVYQNMFFAFFVKLLFIFLAFYGVSSIFEAIFADVGVTLLAILNTFRIIKTKKI